MQPKRTITPKIIQREAITIVGLSKMTTISANDTAQLWSSLGPLRKTIGNKCDAGSYSVQCYGDASLATAFTSYTTYEYWAGVAVERVPPLVPPLKVLHIPSATWAVFTYVGTAKDFGKFIGVIMQEWLPNSGYQLLALPQFQYMDENYLGPHDPEAQEQFWLPIKEAKG